MDLNLIFEINGATRSKSNKKTTVWRIDNGHRGIFERWCEELSAGGYREKERYGFCENHLYAAFSNGKTGIFLNWFGNTGELTAVIEEDCNYFAFSDTELATKTDVQITQIHLEDFGASHVVRLRDGRFIIFDGGREFLQDAERLYQCLKKSTPHENPVIAAWIMTHAHEDHYLCFLTFFEKYSEDVVIEKFMLNFPEHDDVEHFPCIVNDDPRVERNVSATVNIPILWEYIEKCGADVFMPHTGQSYNIGDVRMEIVSCIDDIMHAPNNNINASSTVIRMEIEGQTVLWGADSAMSIAGFPRRFREHLKSDILQVPHHGFGCARPLQEMEAYTFIRPKVCILPVADYHAYTQFCSYKEDTRFLMCDLGVEEFITGDETVTITLPYTTPDYKKYKHLDKLRTGIASNGSKAWVFTNLNTGTDGDLDFTFLNMTNTKVTVTTELYFEDRTRALKYITITLEPNSYKKINIVGNEVDDNAKWFNNASIAKRGVPKNADFAVRFMSDYEIVVSNISHRETYRA